MARKSRQFLPPSRHSFLPLALDPSSSRQSDGFELRLPDGTLLRFPAREEATDLLADVIWSIRQDR